jgi:hypothetical protein
VRHGVEARLRIENPATFDDEIVHSAEHPLPTAWQLPRGRALRSQLRGRCEGYYAPR